MAGPRTMFWNDQVKILSLTEQECCFFHTSISELKWFYTEERAKSRPSRCKWLTHHYLPDMLNSCDCCTRRSYHIIKTDDHLLLKLTVIHFLEKLLHSISSVTNPLLFIVSLCIYICFIITYTENVNKNPVEVAAVLVVQLCTTHVKVLLIIGAELNDITFRIVTFGSLSNRVQFTQ